GRQFFESRHRRVVVARVTIPLFFAREDAVQLLHAFVVKARGGVDGGGDGNMPAGLFAVAGVYGFGVNLHFLFQRTPPLVSSRIIPCSSSCSRIWSACAKFFAFFAAVRSAMSD